MAVQLTDVRRFTGESEYWFAMIKVLMIIVFIIVGLIYDWGGVRGHPGPVRISLSLRLLTRSFHIVLTPYVLTHTRNSVYRVCQTSTTGRRSSAASPRSPRRSCTRFTHTAASSS